MHLADVTGEGLAMKKIFVLAVVAATTVMLGCSSGGTDRENESATASGALTSDVRATNCEVFVDRAIAVSGSHALRQIGVYVKTLNDRLDGPIDHVGFYRKRTGIGCQGNTDCNEDWREERIQAFVGSADYFELELPIGGDYSPGFEYTGSFFVQTTKGTKYWANTKEGGDFVIGDSTFESLRGNPYTSMPHYRSDPQQATATAEGFPYLNPGTCR